MRILSEKQQKQQQKYLEAQIRNRWPYTALYLFWICVSAQEIVQKRRQLPHLIAAPFASGVPIWHQLWVTIFNLLMFSFFLVSLWLRIYATRREQLAAEQLALQKAAPPPDGVWPPPL